MWDSVRAVQNDQHRDIVVTDKALLKVEMERNGGLKGGGHASAAQRLWRGVYLQKLTNFTSWTLYI